MSEAGGSGETAGEEPVQARVLSVSDRASQGVYDDVSGPAVRALLLDAGFVVPEPDVIPDERDQIAARLRELAAGAALVVTTGGTGLAPRDVTPEATRAVIDYEVPGIAELMRSAGVAKTPMAALSRSLAGVHARTLIINLPGSVKGATESLEAVVPLLKHACGQLAGRPSGHDR
jgi:molybdenum cofactor biosynthesis protein B